MSNYIIPEGYKLLHPDDRLKIGDLVFYKAKIKDNIIKIEDGYTLTRYYDKYIEFARTFTYQIFFRKLELTPKGNKIIN